MLNMIEWQNEGDDCVNFTNIVMERCSVRISAWTSPILTEVLRRFPQSIQKNPRITRKLTYGRLLSDPF